MKTFPRRLLTTTVLLVMLTGPIYWFVFRPVQQDIRKVQSQVRAFDQAVASLKSTLASMPPISDAEMSLWKWIEARVDQTVLDEAGLTAGLAQLADLAEDADSKLTMVLIREPEEPRPSATATRSGARPRRAPAEPAPDDSVVRGLQIGELSILYYPATLRVDGPYASWPRFLNRISTALVPVLVDDIRGVPGPELPRLELTLRVPVLQQRGGDGQPEETLEPVEVPDEVAARYYLAKLREPLPQVEVTPSGRPFPDVLFAPPRDLSGLDLTTILRRNGRYVAVVNDRVIGVGDVVDGLRVVRITADSVVFAQDRGEQ